MKYKCGCTADGDNVANYCPIHGDAEDRTTVLLSRSSATDPVTMWALRKVGENVPCTAMSFWPDEIERIRNNNPEFERVKITIVKG